MHALPTHIRLALRMLARRPGLAAGRMMTVTVVVAAVSSVFTVANTTFLRPLPFPQADRLVRIYLQPPGTTDFRSANPLNPLEFERFRERITSFERIDGIWPADRAVTGDGEPDAIPAARVSAGFFDLFGGRPALGRVFTEAEVASDAKLAVIGHGLWIRRYGGDPRIVGRTMIVDREPHAIVGVMQSDFEPALVPSEFWTPLSTRNAMGRTTLTSVRTFGLLRPGRAMTQSQPEVDTVMADLRAEMPAMLKGWTAGLKDMREAQYGAQAPALLMLLAAVAALGLIAVANLANLTLADVMFRRGDFAVRAALGASRGDLAATEIVQSLLVAGAGGAAGLAVSAAIVPLMLALDPSIAVTARQAPLDWRVAACGFAVSALVMLSAVAMPVLRLAGPGLASDVTAGSRRAIGGRTAARIRVLLVAAQTALALVLLSVGGQVLYGLYTSARIQPGFDPEHVVTAQLRLSANAFPEDVDRANFVDRLIDRLRTTPGVVAAGTTLNTFSVNGAFITMVSVEDRPAPDGQPYAVQYRRVSPGYFEAMRIPVLRGRAFERRDWVDAPAVAIVSRSFARRFWGEQDPIGRRIKRGATTQVFSTIVGVVEDVRDVALDQPPDDAVYTPYFQASNPAAPVGLVVRTAGPPSGLITSIKKAVWEVDPTQPLANVVTLDAFLSATLGGQRFRAILVAICGLIGLLLATIGTYGVTARSVVERTREVGIRLALGGRPLEVWWTVAWGSLRAVVAGAVAGIAVSGAAGPGLAALVPGLRGFGWAFSALAAGILLAIGLAAAMIASRRAIAIEPLRALRN